VNLIHEIVSNITRDNQNRLGIMDGGCHSFRKGAISLLAGVPSIGSCFVSLFRRASWALPSLIEIYAHYSICADQTMGRAAAGLDPNTEDFNLLPPRFKESVVDVLSDGTWGDVVVGFEHLQDHVKPVVEMLIASVVRHTDFLRTNLGVEDPIFKNKLYQSNLCVRLQSHLLPECHMECGITKLRATGLQATHIILGKMSEQAKSG
jgi:hypothetical protein